MVSIRVLGPADVGLLASVADEVFDNPLRPELAAEFLADPRHHIAVAIDDGLVVGIATAVHYIHPDKPAELWINEVGVAPSHQRRGLGRQLMQTLLAHGRGLGCALAWVLTERENAAARGLYADAGGAQASDEVVMIEFDLS